VKLVEFKKTRWGVEFKKNRYLYLMIIPPLVWLLIFNYWPLYGVIIAFQDFSLRQGYFRSEWVGLKHFVYLFQKGAFQRAFWNTWIINALRIGVGFPVPVIFALLINEVRNHNYQRAVQTITYLPHFISWVVLAGIFNSLLALDTGAVNHLLATLGLSRIDFLQSNKTFRAVIVLTDIWKEFGWETIIYLSAMAGIDPQLYEAAWVDGAGRWKQVWYITLPSIASTTIIVLLLRLGYILTMGFEQIYNLYSPLVYESGDIIQTYIVRMLQERPNFSRLAAAGLVSSVIGFVLLLAANRLVKLLGREGIY
jgi:putative aldouronate transport system permease protein